MTGRVTITTPSPLPGNLNLLICLPLFYCNEKFLGLVSVCWGDWQKFILDAKDTIWHSSEQEDALIVYSVEGGTAMPYRTLDLQSACEALHGGRVIAFPTETFYGLACNALNPDAIGAVYAMKQRAYGLPLPVVIGDVADLERVAVDIHPLARTLIGAYWPGPLSIIFTASPDVPDLLTAGTGRIAVRFSPHPGSIALCRASGCVLSSSSANVSGNPPAVAPEDIDPAFGERLAGVYVAPPAPQGGKPSTIVEIISSGTQSALRVLRDGAVSAEELRSAGFETVMVDG